MAALLNTSSFIRRLALLAFFFILLFLFLRAPAPHLNDYFGKSPATAEDYETEPPSFPVDPVSEFIDDLPTAFDDSSAPVEPILHDDEPASAPLPETAEETLEPAPKPVEEKKPDSSPRSRISADVQQYLSWDPPVEIRNHYPAYDAYRQRDYDPNRWEGFEQNQLYYTNGSIQQLDPSAQKPVPYDVYPEYNSASWLEQWKGEFVSCVGPSGASLNASDIHLVTAYRGIPAGFPSPDVGSFDAVGLDDNVCFDRQSRLGPYGLESEESSRIDFSRVKWGQLQNDCVKRNAARYRSSDATVLTPGIAQRPLSEPGAHQGLETRADDSRSTVESSLLYKPRSAVLIRTWDNYEYRDNDIQAVRSLVSELSLQSGGEYNVFLFVNVKDTTIPIFTDTAIYQEHLEKYVPEELRDIAILWSETVCNQWYPKVGEWSVYFQQFMPLQWFAETHPEFDYIWNWEMDARYIGQHYHFLEKTGDFARAQPRKYLWERNSRYYFPSVHGSYEDFTEDTNKIVANSPHVDTVWGAQPWSGEQKPSGPTPPTTEALDDFEWGVDEEADFITLLPMWDPRQTWWSYRDKLWGYPPSNASTEERPFPHVPRRVFINTLSRFSRKLLTAMHVENQAGQSMASEMWPASVALQHGLKAVYAPHPIWLAQHWPAGYLDLVFNADGWGAGSLPGTNIDHGRGVAYDKEREQNGLAQQGTGPNREGRLGRWSQERDSVYSPDREHNFAGWSWYFWSDFPKTLYWRWLGWRSSFSIVTIEGAQSTDNLRDVEWSEWEKKNGRMCLPGMLLHPVKNVKAPAPPAPPSPPASPANVDPPGT